jgi:hypothetical protein
MALSSDFSPQAYFLTISDAAYLRHRLAMPPFQYATRFLSNESLSIGEKINDSLGEPMHLQALHPPFDVSDEP